MVSIFFLFKIDVTLMISNYMHMNCNQDFKATSPNIKQVEKAGNYLISLIANLGIDSFYDSC